VKKQRKEDKIQAKRDDLSTFKINEEFARKFEHNKRRELLDKAKVKYGE
jgi:protein KRI1